MLAYSFNDAMRCDTTADGLIVDWNAKLGEQGRIKYENFVYPVSVFISCLHI